MLPYNEETDNRLLKALKNSVVSSGKVTESVAFPPAYIVTLLTFVLLISKVIQLTSLMNN